MGLGVALVLWSIYSTKIELKNISLWFFDFGLHLISLVCISNLFDPYWEIFAVLLAGSSTIFIKLATKLNRYRYMSLLFYTFIWALMFFYLKSLTSLKIDEFNIILILTSTFI
jgi:hypothetical protein